jgi:hypothetical protein
MVYFATKNLNLGKFQRALRWTLFGTFYGHLEYVTAIGYILVPFDNFPSGDLVYFSPFWYTVSRKIWQPWCRVISRRVVIVTAISKAA